ncbi:putative serine/threonine-protein kinase-like protein CCR3 [Aegilops tauschii subsp. strangulata]|uniref:Protein kinase domain-containing protein n=2 Tax=Aegilops tauschii subsp. strangulata TaxID=200361 RepID=A0A453GP07_AEGTS|nr:putative serine/threonine-protein kinase-like protein CCR3 [Aegilops tauschii subsp. strangulata]
MTLWSELSDVATVAQLVGADVAGLISVIMLAAETARQNRRECRQLARRVLIISRLLPLVQDPESARPMAGLCDTLREAHELLQSCQRRSAAYRLFMAGRKAVRFREMQNKIDFYLLLFPVTSHIAIARRLDRIYNLLDTTGAGGEPSTLPQPSQLQQESTVVDQEVVPYEIHEFTFAEIVAATDYFDPHAGVESDQSVTMYRGTLHDGREVAVRRIMDRQSSFLQEEFRTELEILPRLQHKHIVRLLGSCVTARKDQQQKKKRLLSWWRKEPKEPEWLTVYEYMENNTLFHHLHPDQGSTELSPVTVSWKTRIDVLLGVSRAIEHMHCHANPPIIHWNIKPANILFDASWVPRLSGFGSSVVWDMASEESGMTCTVTGTIGYIDPEYMTTRHVKPTNDVYSLGIMMLEVVTGRKVIEKDDQGDILPLTSFAVPIVEAGNIRGLLDTRPVPEPTPGQLRALENVARTARCCVKEKGKDRPAIPDIVANLETALELFCKDEPSSVHESPEHDTNVVFPSLPASPEITLAEVQVVGGHEKCTSDPGGSSSNFIDGTQHLKITNSI